MTTVYLLIHNDTHWPPTPIEHFAKKKQFPLELTMLGELNDLFQYFLISLFPHDLFCS